MFNINCLPVSFYVMKYILTTLIHLLAIGFIVTEY